jgi:FtsP/CotA-like multicopper oxidase with cupredoxin domain
MLSVVGRSIPGFTVNGTSPGPEIRARQGQLIEVHLRNESVADGVTLHWHGVADGVTLHWHGLDVPNAMDGVAGVTQDAVAVGVSSLTVSSRTRLARTGITPTRSPIPKSPEGSSDHWW